MMGRPKVSILLPVRNAGPFLAERLRSIRGQTLDNWELIVLDGYSDDGSWEKLVEFGRSDDRVRCFREKPRGIYRAFNDSIRLAGGEYIYFATADDTMDSQCLQVMMEGLECNPECDLAHCLLQIIDEEGRLSDKKWDDFYYNRYYGKLLQEWHIRKAPHDGWLHFLGVTAYTSLTQMLFRKRLFEELGLFREDFGSIGDFEWYMRVTMRRDTLHIPFRLASWRVHGQQATNENAMKKAVVNGQFLKMAKIAVKGLDEGLHPSGMDARELWSLLERDAQYGKHHPWDWLTVVLRRLFAQVSGGKKREESAISYQEREAFLARMMGEKERKDLLLPAQKPHVTGL